MAQRPRFDRIWSSASANTIRDPGTQKYNTGWVSEIPTYQVLNFLQNKADLTFLAIAERGVAEWGSDVTYVKSGIAWDEEVGKVFLATVNAPNKNLRPNKNPTQWVESSVNIPRTDYDVAKKTMLDHVADVTSNPHKLTPAGLNAYTKAQVDSILAQYRALVDAHVKDTANPHKTTAADIGAVPITGGTYSGLVTFASKFVYLAADGSNKFFNDATGTWLGQGTGRLGITAGGVPSVGPSNELSPIITEQTFDANKLKVENLYAVPEPEFIMNCIRDANIQKGPGVWNATWDIQFAGDTGWMILDMNAQRRDYLATDNPIAGAREATIAINMRFRENVAASTGPSGNRQVIGMGGPSPNSRLIFVFNVVSQGTRYCAVYSGDSGSITTNPVPMPDNKIHKLVGVRRSDRIEMWIDGVMVSSKMTPNTVPIAGVGNGISCSPVADTKDESRLEIANFRMWRSALTAEQISRL